MVGKSEGFGNYREIEIKPSFLGKVVWMFIPMVIYVISIYTFGDFDWNAFLTCISFSILIYFIVQLDCHSFKISRNRIIVSYPLSFYRTSKVIKPEQINFVYCKDETHVPSDSTYLTIVLNSNKKINVLLGSYLGSARYELKELGVKIINAKNKWDRASNYIDE